MSASPSPEHEASSQNPGKRRPGRWRRWFVRPAVWLSVLLLLLLTAAALYVSSDRFERRIEALVEERATEALGRSVTLDDLELSLWTLAAEASGLRVAGPSPDDPPVLTARHVTVDLSLLDLAVWGGESTAIQLDQVILEEPRFELRYDETGASNLPELAKSGAEAAPGTQGFEVRLGRLLVQKGVFLYDDRRVPLHLDARDLQGHLDGGAPDGSRPYRFLLTARTMETRWPSTEPFAPAVSLEASLYPDRLELTRGRLEAPDFQADLSGQIRWREPLEVRIDIEARAAASWANRLGYLEEPIAGPVAFDGLYLWTPDDWRYGGELRADSLDFLQRRVEAIEGGLAGSAHEVRVDVDEARHGGGNLRGSFVLDLSTPGREGGGDGYDARIDAVGEGLSLRSLLDGFGVDLEGLAGNLTARLDYRFSTEDVWRGDGEGRVGVERLRRPTDRQAVRGEAPLSIRDGVVRVIDGRLAASEQNATVDLTYDLVHRTGALRYRVDSQDLAELARWLSEPLGLEAGPDGASSPPPWWPTAGRGTVAGTMDLFPDRVLGRVALDFDEVATASLQVDHLEGSCEHGPQGISALEARMERGGGELWVTGDVILADTSTVSSTVSSADTPSGDSKASVELDLEVGGAGWPLASLRAGLDSADSVPDLEGGLNGYVEVRGPVAAPRIQGSLWVEPLHVAGFVIDRAEVDLDWEGSSGRLERLALIGPPGRLVGSGTLDLDTGTLDFQVAAAELSLERSTALAGLASPLQGTLGLQGTVAGTLDAPRAELRLDARGLSLGGASEARSLGRDGQAELVASWADGRLQARGSLLGLLRFEGGGRLDAAGTDLELQVRSERLAEILTLVWTPQPGLAGSFVGELDVSGDWTTGTEALRGRLELAELVLTREDLEIHNLQPVVAELTRAEVDIESLFLGNDRTGSELFVAGSIGLEPGDFPLDLRVQTSLDAVWFEPFLPEIQIDGAFDALATVRGTAAAPEINGQGEIRGGQAIVPGFPHSLDAVSAIVFFYPQEVVLQQLESRFASGRLRASGRLDMPRGDEPLVYDLQIEARSLTLRYPAGWTLRGGGELFLRAPAEGGGRELGGTVRLNRAFYVQDVRLGLFQVVQGALQRQRLALQETDELLASTQLSLSLEGDNALRVRNNVADLSGDISLSLHGTLARPVVFGRVELERGGSLEFRDIDYVVERGLLTFANPYEIEPVIDLVASTEVRRYDVQLMLSGTLERLNANFSSTPPLADLEVLGLLATGSAPGDQIGGQQQVAERFLFGQAASAISRRVNTLFGFDRFRISPGQGEEIGSGIGFSAEKRLSRDVTVIFSRDPSSTEREILQIAWDVSDEVTLILSREGDGSFALDARWEKSF